jgi:hypothetical protein
MNIFISYSDLDKDKLKTLKIKLSRKLLKPIIVADKKIALTQLTEKVIKGISESDVIVPIITSNSMNAQWLNQEIGYSTAIGKDIWPIVDSNILDKLKGFIHKQLDLPYTFNSNSNDRKKEVASYRNCCDDLIGDLLLKNVQDDTIKNDMGVETWAEIERNHETVEVIPDIRVKIKKGLTDEAKKTADWYCTNCWNDKERFILHKKNSNAYVIIYFCPRCKNEFRHNIPQEPTKPPSIAGWT